ncbi:hypothetical protein [Mariniblastus fucicola]|uniref:Uncharacterized protein n=1 Tax=Mariniblastus fucicola TaxID=980251 RepID=A0A5B9PEU1_9BACT|nr:hypothetical protein [Mariniblastus fucicola]QEG21501.1 hypothetical protein MFFC18_13570 [Mariniblastus fucicola]
MRLYILAVLLTLCCGTIHAQESAVPDVFQDADTMSWLNRTVGSIDIAEEESKTESDLLLTESQRLEIGEIYASHQEMMAFGETVPPEKRQDKKFVNEIFSFYMSELKSLESNLNQKVLLPDQVSRLSRKLFLRNLERHEGDVVKVISDIYSDKIKLDEKRKDKLAEVVEASKKEVAEAKKKFKAELKRILEKNDKATRELLTGQEKAILGMSAE